jgi:hypothetical protein
MIDIKFTPEGDIDMTSGDFQYVESTEQHQRDILLAAKGHFKSAPEIGVDAFRYINEINPDAFFRSVRREFARDGMKIKSMSAAKIEASYD